MPAAGVAPPPPAPSTPPVRAVGATPASPIRGHVGRQLPRPQRLRGSTRRRRDLVRRHHGDAGRPPRASGWSVPTPYDGDTDKWLGAMAPTSTRAPPGGLADFPRRWSTPPGSMKVVAAGDVTVDRESSWHRRDSTPRATPRRSRRPLGGDDDGPRHPGHRSPAVEAPTAQQAPRGEVGWTSIARGPPRWSGGGSGSAGPQLVACGTRAWPIPSQQVMVDLPPPTLPTTSG
jgi:hypothetical protein